MELPQYMMTGTSQSILFWYFILVTLATIHEIQDLSMFNIFWKYLNFRRLVVSLIVFFFFNAPQIVIL